MTKVHGKRYAYKFDFHGLMAACHSQAQGCDPSGSMIPKYHPHHHLLMSNEFSNYATSSAGIPSTSNSSGTSFKPIQSTALSSSSVLQPSTSSTESSQQTSISNASATLSNDRSSIFWPYPPTFDPRSHNF